MRAAPIRFLVAGLCLVACSADETPHNGPPAVEAGSSTARFAGELALRGDVALFSSGSVRIEIVRRGGDEPILARSWELGDPVWNLDRDGARLYFALDARDAWRGSVSGLGSEMELVARFDPDGNPATDEPGVARARLPVRAGALDLVVELTLEPVVAARDVSAGR